MTFYDITDPPVESALTSIPVPLLRKAIAILGKTGRSQMIAITDGEGVRFLAKSKCMGYIAFIWQCYLLPSFFQELCG
jgi:ESCRT-II complex subunit VPS25